MRKIAIELDIPKRSAYNKMCSETNDTENCKKSSGKLAKIHPKGKRIF